MYGVRLTLSDGYIISILRFYEAILSNGVRWLSYKRDPDSLVRECEGVLQQNWQEEQSESAHCDFGKQQWGQWLLD